MRNPVHLDQIELVIYFVLRNKTTPLSVEELVTIINRFSQEEIVLELDYLHQLVKLGYIDIQVDDTILISIKPAGLGRYVKLFEDLANLRWDADNLYTQDFQQVLKQLHREVNPHRSPTNTTVQDMLLW